MQADFSVELGRDDPALEIPWSSEDGAVRYYDLRSNPEALAQIPEAVAYPELSAFLARMNAPDSRFATAKCDVWQSSEILPEEEIFGAERKFASYIDLVFLDETDQCSFATHEKLARELCELLGRAPDMAAAVEVVVRRCYYRRRDCDGETGHAVQRGEGRLGKQGSDGSDKDEKSRGGYGLREDGGRELRDRSTMIGQAGVGAADEETGGGKGESAEIGESENSDERGDGDRVSDMRACSLNMPSKMQSVSATLHVSADAMSILPNMSEQGGDTIKISQDISASRLNAPEALSNTKEDFVVKPNEMGGGENTSVSGFYSTAYINGFGHNDSESRGAWGIAVVVLQHALVQWGSRLILCPGKSGGV